MILRMCVFTHWEKNNIPNPFVKEKEMASGAWHKVFCIVIPWLHPTKFQTLILEEPRNWPASLLMTTLQNFR
jgi:isocitrate dehydrogenase kinase/phosphatase